MEVEDEARSLRLVSQLFWHEPPRLQAAAQVARRSGHVIRNARCENDVREDADRRQTMSRHQPGRQTCQTKTACKHQKLACNTKAWAAGQQPADHGERKCTVLRVSAQITDCPVKAGIPRLPCPRAPTHGDAVVGNLEWQRRDSPRRLHWVPLAGRGVHLCPVWLVRMQACFLRSLRPPRRRRVLLAGLPRGARLLQALRHSGSCPPRVPRPSSP